MTGDPRSERPEASILRAWARLGVAPPGTPDASERSAIAARLVGLGVIACADDAPDYPPALRDLADAPRVMFRIGSPWPASADAVAIVGSRAASPYGVRMAHRLAGDLARLGFTVVSGLARGVDAAAHEGALAAGGRTIAVLPGGLDAITPPHHRSLAERIAASGALVSEIPSGPPRHRGGFVQRNRLIAALAAATVVVEAAVGSGALTTALAARRLGRALLAVPGDVDRDTALGCVALLREGAQPCVGAADVLAALGYTVPTRRSRVRRATTAQRALGADSDAVVGAARLPSARVPVTAPSNAPMPSRLTMVGDSPPERRVLALLAPEPCSVEALAHAAGLDLAATFRALLALAWSGAATRHPGGRWAAGRSGAPPHGPALRAGGEAP